MKALFSGRKWLVLLAGVMIVIVLLAFALWRIVAPAAPLAVESITEPPLRFGYCGAELTELCILSFGRDADGNAIINFFAPRDFPDFYLNIQRFDGAIVYVCVRNGEIPTSVVCMGDVINLNERVEISVMSTEGYRLLAKGAFVLKAILLSTQSAGGGESRTPTLESAPPSQTPPSTSPPSPSYPGETPTPSPSVSYPSNP